KPAAQEQVAVHLAYRTEQSEKLSRMIANLDGDVLVGGDFNTPGEGSIYRTYWSQFSDAFNTAGFGVGHTYFAAGAAVRIDHILYGSRWQCTDCRVAAGIGSP